MLPWWLTRVRGRSMEPALRPGQLVLTRAVRPAARVRRGDLVVAEPAGVRERVVKRVVGLPGERIELRDGVVSVDDVVLDEPYTTASVYRGTFDVPPGHYLLLGDHRDASDDARSWPRPCVPRDRIVGRLLRRRRRAARPGPTVRGVRAGGGSRQAVCHGQVSRPVTGAKPVLSVRMVRLLPPAASVAPAGRRP